MLGTYFSKLLSNSTFTAVVNVKDEPDRYIIQADVPGVDPNLIDLIFDNGILILKGHRDSFKEEKKTNFLRAEHTQRSFYHKVNLRAIVNAEEIAASSKNGVLEVTLPKLQRSKPKKIQVQIA